MGYHHHHHHPALVARDDSVQLTTVVSIVYVTASPTFDGPIGGYVTLTPDLPTTTTADGSSSTATRSADATDASTTTATTKSPVIPVRSHRPGHKSETSSVDTTSSSSDVVAASSSSYSPTSSSSETPIIVASSFASTTLVISTASVSSTTASSSLQTSAFTASGASTTSGSQITTIEDETSNDMSTGAKAGTAIGVLLAVGLLFAVALFLYRRKRDHQNDSHQEIDDFDEKPAPAPSNNVRASRISLRNSYFKAPRLSLGPLNHIFPVMSERSSVDRTNPFGDHAAPIINEKNHPMLPSTGAPAIAVVPKPLSIKSDRAVQNTASSSPSLRQSPQPATQSSNVHRVQLEFKPSMDDELELRPGQLVRMLHEYDDGWALCIRLDRSQQGVVPRTCISKMPLKPRPVGPPSAGMRHGQRGGQRMSPAGSTSSMTSYTSDDSVPRPLSPGNGRMRSGSNASYLGQVRNSEGLDGRPRSNSANTFDAPRTAPFGMSPLNPTSVTPYSNNMHRKPVPGQAL